MNVDELLPYVLAFLLSFLLGTIPFGWVLTRAAGLGDIRRVGSGNIGATNVLRTGRKGLAAATLLLDGGKGAVAVLVVGWLLGPVPGFAAGAFAVIGHCRSIWMRGKGGKGVATGLGVLLAAAWPVGLAACATWLATARLTRISSAGALAAFALAPVLMWAWGGWRMGVIAAVASSQVFVRHADNIRRLRAGTEPRIGQKG